MTEEEIKEIAKRAITNEICFACTEESINDHFGLFISLWSDEQVEELNKNNIASVWEEYSKSSPRAINGKAIFFSGHFLTEEQTKGVIKEIQRIQKAMEA